MPTSTSGKRRLLFRGCARPRGSGRRRKPHSRSGTAFLNCRGAKPRPSGACASHCGSGSPSSRLPSGSVMRSKRLPSRPQQQRPRRGTSRCARLRSESRLSKSRLPVPRSGPSSLSSASSSTRAGRSSRAPSCRRRRRRRRTAPLSTSSFQGRRGRPRTGRPALPNSSPRSRRPRSSATPRSSGRSGRRRGNALMRSRRSSTGCGSSTSRTPSPSPPRRQRHLSWRSLSAAPVPARWTLSRRTDAKTNGTPRLAGTPRHPLLDAAPGERTAAAVPLCARRRKP
mmetsp:Transcript_29752/g.70940  ORF Transcript_29752/g.70940 Transcript_29752/m.70940 type:complete len:283 (+) Transcript_29752:592-1440(+)